MSRKSSILFLITFVVAGCTNQLYGCSGIYIATNNMKIFGFNEDHWNHDSFYTTMPASENRFGLIGFGHSKSIQAIINEKGLCYDGYGAPDKQVTCTGNKPTNQGGFIFEAMTTCELVMDVKKLYDKYCHPWLNNGQAFFTDRFGNSAIFESDTVIFKTGDYQLCTNFYQSDPESCIASKFYPCRRYSLLQEELENTENYSVDFLKDLLEKVHVKDQDSPHGLISTMYSLIIDQNAGKVYVFFEGSYKNGIVLNISEELAKPQQRKMLNSMF